MGFGWSNDCLDLLDMRRDRCPGSRELIALKGYCAMAGFSLKQVLGKQINYAKEAQSNYLLTAFSMSKMNSATVNFCRSGLQPKISAT